MAAHMTVWPNEVSACTDSGHRYSSNWTADDGRAEVLGKCLGFLLEHGAEEIVVRRENIGD